MDQIAQSLGYLGHDGPQRRDWRGAGGRCDFRVSLSRTSAAPSADQTAKTLAYLVPVGKGLILDLFDGEDWVPRKIAYDPDQRSQRDVVPTDLAVMTTTTVPYDLFVRWRGGRAETKLVAWASATARNGASIAAPWLHESGLGMHEGILCRADGSAGAAAAGRLDPYWRYVATLYPSASGQCEDSIAKRLVSNALNREWRYMSVVDTTNTWTYNTAAWRQANASAANQVAFVLGLAGVAVAADVLGMYYAGTGSFCQVGIGLDSTTVNSAQIVQGEHSDGNTRGVFGKYDGCPSIGYHYLAWLEIVNGTTTWVGDLEGTYGPMQSGLRARILA